MPESDSFTGLAAGTVLVKDITTGPSAVQTKYFTNVNGTLSFSLQIWDFTELV